MIVIHSDVPVKPDSRTAAIELLEDIADRSRAESGVVDYRVTSDLEDPNTLRIIEQYEDETAQQSHESSDHVAEFQREMEPHLAAVAELSIYEVTSTRTAPGP
jgi:quinol monooxygenase YgiN